MSVIKKVESSMERGSRNSSSWDKTWDNLFKDGWIKNKGKYRFLRRIFPRLSLRLSPRKDYYLGVARLVEGRFCDFGCGFGAVAGIYALLSGEKSFGIDHSHLAMTHAAREARYFKVSCAFSTTSIFNTGLKDNVFDTVYIGHVLEHLKDDDDMAALIEAKRILCPEGKLIVSVPRDDKIPDPDHVREYTEISLHKLLGGLGVKDVCFHEIDPRRFIVSCRVEK